VGVEIPKERRVIGVQDQEPHAGLGGTVVTPGPWQQA
jgi:hypothetical protein